jgi:hypothetical protein
MMRRIDQGRRVSIGGVESYRLHETIGEPSIGLMTRGTTHLPIAGEPRIKEKPPSKVGGLGMIRIPIG